MSETSQLPTNLSDAQESLAPCANLGTVIVAALTAALVIGLTDYIGQWQALHTSTATRPVISNAQHSDPAALQTSRHSLPQATRAADPRSDAAAEFPHIHRSGHRSTDDVWGALPALSVLFAGLTLSAIGVLQHRTTPPSTQDVTPNDLHSWAMSSTSATSTAQQRVILLKDPAEEGEDPYEAKMEGTCYTPIFVPVLRFEFLQPPNLPEALLDPSLAAVVVTSFRSCESLQWALSLQSLQGVRDQFLQSFPVFGVGPKTCAALRKVGFQNVSGDDTGSAAELGPKVIEFWRSHPEPKKVLFLRGDKALETLPQLLTEAGVPFEAIVTYNTIEGVPDDTVQTLQAIEGLGARDWVGLFSPSGVRAVVALRDKIPGFQNIRKASIGKTTSAAIEKELGEVAEAVAERPNAEKFLEAIMRYDINHP